MKKLKIIVPITGVIATLWNKVINPFSPVSVPLEEKRRLSDEEEKMIDAKVCIKCNDGVLTSKLIDESYVKWTCPGCGSVYEQYFPMGHIYLMPPKPAPTHQVC